MTADELKDLRSIAQAVSRIETSLADHGHRLDLIEENWTRVLGALSVVKWLLGFVGASGLAAIVLMLGQK